MGRRDRQDRAYLSRIQTSRPCSTTGSESTPHPLSASSWRGRWTPADGSTTISCTDSTALRTRRRTTSSSDYRTSRSGGPNCNRSTPKCFRRSFSGCMTTSRLFAISRRTATASATFGGRARDTTIRSPTVSPVASSTKERPRRTVAVESRSIPVVSHRDLPTDATVKAVTVKREPTGRWYAVLSVETPDDPSTKTDEPESMVGIDVGIVKFAHDTDRTAVGSLDLSRESEGWNTNSASSRGKSTDRRIGRNSAGRSHAATPT